MNQGELISFSDILKSLHLVQVTEECGYPPFMASLFAYHLDGGHMKQAHYWVEHK